MPIFIIIFLLIIILILIICSIIITSLEIALPLQKDKSILGGGGKDEFTKLINFIKTSEHFYSNGKWTLESIPNRDSILDEIAKKWVNAYYSGGKSLTISTELGKILKNYFAEIAALKNKANGTSLTRILKNGNDFLQKYNTPRINIDTQARLLEEINVIIQLEIVKKQKKQKKIKETNKVFHIPKLDIQYMDYPKLDIQYMDYPKLDIQYMDYPIKEDISTEEDKFVPTTPNVDVDTFLPIIPAKKNSLDYLFRINTSNSPIKALYLTFLDNYYTKFSNYIEMYEYENSANLKEVLSKEVLSSIFKDFCVDFYNTYNRLKLINAPTNLEKMIKLQKILDNSKISNKNNLEAILAFVDAFNTSSKGPLVASIKDAIVNKTQTDNLAIDKINSYIDNDFSIPETPSTITTFVVGQDVLYELRGKTYSATILAYNNDDPPTYNIKINDNAILDKIRYNIPHNKLKKTMSMEDMFKDKKTIYI
jgi:hypothetical protein